MTCQRCDGDRDVRPVRESNRTGSTFTVDLCRPCRMVWYAARQDAKRPRLTTVELPRALRGVSAVRVSAVPE